MKYICLGYYDKSKFESMTEGEQQAMFDTCLEYDDHLRANGHFAGGEALQPPDTALTLYWKNGKVATTDGPYAETKEQLGGILILEARDMNHAIQLMAQHPALTYGNIFEIRPAADMNEIVKASEQRRRQNTDTMQTVYEAAGSLDGLLRLAHAWHTRVLEDEVVSHAFSHGYHPDHTERLAAYWAEALGGPTTYSDRYGDETSVVRIHSGNGLHEEMDQRAIACFDQALQDAGLDGDERLRRVLHDYFAWATTTTMSRYHDSAEDVPDGLQIPKWSWNGLVSPITHSR